MSRHCRNSGLDVLHSSIPTPWCKKRRDSPGNSVKLQASASRYSRDPAEGTGLALSAEFNNQVYPTKIRSSTQGTEDNQIGLRLQPSSHGCTVPRRSNDTATMHRKLEIDCAIRLSSPLNPHNGRCRSIPTHRLTAEVPLTGPTPILNHTLIVLKVLKVLTSIVHQTLPVPVDPEVATQVTNRVPRRAQIRNFGSGSKQSM